MERSDGNGARQLELKITTLYSTRHQHDYRNLPRHEREHGYRVTFQRPDQCQGELRISGLTSARPSRTQHPSARTLVETPFGAALGRSSLRRLEAAHHPRRAAWG